MEQPLLRVLLLRAALFALPFVLWFVWRAVARKLGRDPGAAPWAWLFSAGALLVVLSLMASVVFHRDNRGERYVPADTAADGSVTRGGFEEAK